MHDIPERRQSEVPETQEPSPGKPISPWHIAGWLCAGVIAISVSTCVIIAMMRSTGLSQITVTALDESAEPRDHQLPLIKQKEALPDYELTVILTSGRMIHLGAKPNQSAAKGLTWRLSNPPSIKDVASIRLDEQDKVISDALAEVQYAKGAATANGYRFDFMTQRSTSVGMTSFFATPIGKAIVLGFILAVVVAILSIIAAVTDWFDWFNFPWW